MSFMHSILQVTVPLEMVYPTGPPFRTRRLTLLCSGMEARRTGSWTSSRVNRLLARMVFVSLCIISKPDTPSDLLCFPGSRDLCLHTATLLCRRILPRQRYQRQDSSYQLHSRSCRLNTCRCHSTISSTSHCHYDRRDQGSITDRCRSRGIRFRYHFQRR